MIGKISQAMKYGVPVVATSVATMGMPLVHGKDVLIGDTASEFAKHLVQLYTNCSVWDHIVSGGSSNIRQHSSPHQAHLHLFKALAEAGLPHGVNGKHYC